MALSKKSLFINGALIGCALTLSGFNADVTDYSDEYGMIEFRLPDTETLFSYDPLFPSRNPNRMTRAAKQQAFQSGRVAFLEAPDGKVTLKIHDPFDYTESVTAYKDLKSFTPLMTLAWKYSSKATISEEYYPGSGPLKKGFDRLIHSTTRAPENNNLVDT